MFVPRTLRLKGVKEPQKPPKEPPAKKRRTEDNALESGKIAPAVVFKEEQNNANPKTTKGSNLITPATNPEYLGQLVCGIELVFTDYAQQDKESSSWLVSHYREVDGRGNCTYCSMSVQRVLPTSQDC